MIGLQVIVSTQQQRRLEMNTNRKVLTLIALSTVALMGGAASTASASSDVYSIRSSCTPYTSTYAGYLYIDGRRFTIRSYNNIGRQIAHAFRKAGYDASCRDGRVIVCYDYRCPPRVRWHQRGYRASFEQCDGQMEICWSRVYKPAYRIQHRNDRHDSHWDRGRDRGHHSGRDRGHHSKRWGGRRGRCD